jgi:hypothetical protein
MSFVPLRFLSRFKRLFFQPLNQGWNPDHFPSVNSTPLHRLFPALVEHGSDRSRTAIRTNPDTIPTQSGRLSKAIRTAARANRTPFRTIPDTIPMVSSKLFGFGRNTVRLQSERCTLWIGTLYAFASERCTECPVIRTFPRPHYGRARAGHGRHPLYDRAAGRRGRTVDHPSIQTLGRG